MKKYIENIKRLLSKVKQILKRFGHWYVHRFKGQPWWYKAIAGIISFVVFVILYFTAVNLNFLWLFGKSPTIHSIMHPETSEASELYSEDSVLIGKYFNENRTPVEYEEINPVFFKALIDTEDERFYSHHGIDFQGLFAAFKDILKGHARGASTLTQQLVKNMFRVRTQFKRFRNKDCRKNILQYHAQRPYGRTGGCIGGFVESYKHIQSKDKPGKQYYAAQRGARQYAKARTSDKAGMRFDKETAAWPEL